MFKPIKAVSLIAERLNECDLLDPQIVTAEEKRSDEYFIAEEFFDAEDVYHEAAYLQLVLADVIGKLSQCDPSATLSMMLNITADDIFNISIDNITFEMKSNRSGYIPYAERPETYIVPIIFSLILIVGVVGNGVLILILLCDSGMRNVPNTYVLSLAIGDLLVILTTVPFTSVIYTFESWPWGEIICKLSEFVKDISIGVSVFTLAALSAERYYAIVNPIRRHTAGLSAKPLTILIAILIWVLAIVLAMPSVLFSYVITVPLRTRTILVCTPFPEEFGIVYEKGIIMLKFLVYYVIPLFVIASFYLGMAWHLALSTRNMPGELPDGDHHNEQINARKRVSKMVVCFIIVFVICFLPYHIFMLWFHFYPTARRNYNRYWHVFRIISFCLSFSNSCANPIALYLISRTFRQKFNRYLCCCLRRRNQTEGTVNHGHGTVSQQSRRMFHETNFGFALRKRTQGTPNSTRVFEMGSIESKPNIVIETCSPN